MHWNSRKNILTQEYNVTGLESDSKYEFRVFVSNVAGRKREPAVKEFNVYSGVDVTPTPTNPGKISSFSQGRIWWRGGGGGGVVWREGQLVRSPTVEKWTLINVA